MAISTPEASRVASEKAGLKVATAVFIGGVVFTAFLRPETAPVVGYYTDNLTGTGQCLSGTEYDPSEGATVTEGDSNGDGHPTVVVSPENSAASDMTLLFEGNLDDTSHFFTFVSGSQTAETLFEKCLAD